MSAAGLVALWLGLSAMAAQPTQPATTSKLAKRSAEEWARIRVQLAQERAAAFELASKERDVLEIVDRLERISRQSNRKISVLRAQQSALAAQVIEARELNEDVDRAVELRARNVSPGLQILYRVMRRDRLSTVLASSEDVVQVVRRSRALKRLVEKDLSALQSLTETARFHRTLSGRLESVQAAAESQRERLWIEAGVARERAATVSELRTSIRKSVKRSRSVIAALAKSDRRLQRVFEQSAEGQISSLGAMKGRLPLPTRGVVEMAFGRVVNPATRTILNQRGLDFRAAPGTPVTSVAAGAVVFSGWLKGYGNLVIIDHGGGFHSLVAHLDELDVAVGALVQQKDPLGTVGETGSLKGPFLYFELRREGEAIDPMPWLDFQG